MKVSNWNGNPSLKNPTIYQFNGKVETEEEFCVRGNGRSYGDVSLYPTMLSMLHCRKELILHGDILTVSSGYTLSEVLNYVVPKGYIVPVIPGTQHVTIGGMIAADVHGKNHQENGTIGCWIDSIDLLLTDGSEIHCSRDENSNIFAATIGGIGLTGIILRAKIRLEKIRSTQFTQRVIQEESLMDLVKTLDTSTAKYKVGWFDFSKMSSFFLIETEEAIEEQDVTGFQLRKSKITIPIKTLPFVNEPLMNIYNKRFAKNMSRQNSKLVNIGLDETFFPLDRIRNWNRLYGTRGFYQFQFSFALNGLESKLNEIVEIIQSSGHIPVLSVVKKHGDRESPGMLSYPHPGISIALDFINRKGVDIFLRELYGHIARLGGRIYLIKDALLDVDDFNKMYSNVNEFKEIVGSVNDGRITSLMAKRLNLNGRMKKQVLIIGANSDIGFSCAEEFLKNGCELILAAHKPEELAPIDAKVIHVDVTNQAAALETLANIDCDIVLYAAGKMVENEQALFSEAGQLVLDVNYNGAVAILGHFAEKFARKKSGVIVGISSVAADRGKSSNVVYGSSKAGFDSFLAGLRQYLHSFGVRVLTIRPGYVNTKMTAGLDLPKKLTASKEQVARKIVKHSLSGSRNIVYVSTIWRPIMWTLKQIPERIFKRKKL